MKTPFRSPLWSCGLKSFFCFFPLESRLVSFRHTYQWVFVKFFFWLPVPFPLPTLRFCFEVCTFFFVFFFPTKEGLIEGELTYSGSPPSPSSSSFTVRGGRRDPYRSVAFIGFAVGVTTSISPPWKYIRSIGPFLLPLDRQDFAPY